MVFEQPLFEKPSFSRWFFLVFSRKRWFFWFETIFFSRKRWFLSSRSSKNHLFPKKRWFLEKNYLFLEKKMVFGGLVLVKPSFSREKDGFWRSCPGKTIFFSRKRWFFEEQLLKNHLFLERKMVSNQKNHLFLEKTKKTIFWRPQPHSFGKDGFFGFFGFFGFLDFFGLLVFVSFLFCCFFALIWLGLGCHPRWVHWGGVSIYIYMYMFGRFGL